MQINLQLKFQVLSFLEFVFEKNFFQEVRIQVVVNHLRSANLFILVFCGSAHIPEQMKRERTNKNQNSSHFLKWNSLLLLF